MHPKVLSPFQSCVNNRADWALYSRYGNRYRRRKTQNSKPVKNWPWIAIGIHPTKARLSQLVNFKNAIWTWGHFRWTICNKLFFFKLGKNATETYGMLQTAFRPSCMNRAPVFRCHKRFKEGKESVRDYEKCRRSKEVKTQELNGQRVRVTMLRF